jgi:hypothetical protein
MTALLWAHCSGPKGLASEFLHRQEGKWLSQPMQEPGVAVVASRCALQLVPLQAAGLSDGAAAGEAAALSVPGFDPGHSRRRRRTTAALEEG